MPKFFFGVLDGERYGRDARGLDLHDVGHVWRVAVPMAEAIGLSKRPGHSAQIVSVYVRDTSDVIVYRSDFVVGPENSPDLSEDGLKAQIHWNR